MRTEKKPSGSEAGWDAIVIGSGMGGLSVAAALSRTGHQVLLLEQYQTLGGLTHSFSRNGFRWDVGLHYLSGVAPGEPERALLDWLCDSPIDLAPMGTIYDVLHIGSADPLLLSRPCEAQVLDLKERFPDESKAIDAWFEAVHKGREAAMAVLQTRGMPQPIGAFLEWWKRGDLQRWCGRTTAEVVAEITNNPELAAVFFAQWGDHGGRPSKASFAVHALVAYSYLERGGWYPARPSINCCPKDVATTIGLRRSVLLRPASATFRCISVLRGMSKPLAQQKRIIGFIPMEKRMPSGRTHPTASLLACSFPLHPSTIRIMTRARSNNTPARYSSGRTGRSWRAGRTNHPESVARAMRDSSKTLKLAYLSSSKPIFHSRRSSSFFGSLPRRSRW